MRICDDENDFVSYAAASWTAGPHGWENRYLRVDISQQGHATTLLHYWCLTDGLCGMECPAVCGSPSLSVPTVLRQFSRCTLLRFFPPSSFKPNDMHPSRCNRRARSRDWSAYFITAVDTRAKVGKLIPYALFLRRTTRRTNLSAIDNPSVIFYCFPLNAIECFHLERARLSRFRILIFNPFDPF